MLQSVGAWWMWSGFAVFVIAMIARGHVFPASPRRGVLWFTPLFLVLVLVELSDIVFAVDSIPAGAGLS